MLRSSETANGCELGSPSLVARRNSEKKKQESRTQWSIKQLRVSIAALEFRRSGSHLSHEAASSYWVARRLRLGSAPLALYITRRGDRRLAMSLPNLLTKEKGEQLACARSDAENRTRTHFSWEMSPRVKTNRSQLEAN
jgi:hypothetical protein